jgi:hypothetical protein
MDNNITTFNNSSYLNKGSINNSIISEKYNEIAEQPQDNYMNNPILLEKFSKSYLNSLRVYLDDNSFKQKSSSLPKINTIMITKLEKMIDREEKDKKRKTGGNFMDETDRTNQFDKTNQSKKYIYLLLLNIYII